MYESEDLPLGQQPLCQISYQNDTVYSFPPEQYEELKRAFISGGGTIFTGFDVWGHERVLRMTNTRAVSLYTEESLQRLRDDIGVEKGYNMRHNIDD